MKASALTVVLTVVSIVVLIVALVLFSGCVFETCEDGTFYGQCSKRNPFHYCAPDGNLVEDANRCSLEKFGLDRNTGWDNNFSGEEKKCSEGTKEGECSKKKPNYCEDGNLMEKASVCGCPEGKEIVGEECAETSGPKVWNGEFSYTLRGESGKLNVSLDKGLKDYLSGISRDFVCYLQCPSRTQMELRLLDNERQKPALENIVRQIKEKAGNPDDQARIAVSLVQKIPYDMNSLLSDSNYLRYPYEVIYDNSGVCGEKSKLLAFFLREIGFGTAIFIFEKENHGAVGIKCPLQYSYKNTGYCFIESTTPSIITDSNGDYLGAGKLESTPEILKISDGNSFDSVKEEFEDNLQYKKLFGQATESSYKQWRAIRNKYGFQATSCDANQNYCDGSCRASCGQHYIFVCGGSGGYCTPDPNNCPQEMAACKGTCVPSCEKGALECEIFEKACETTGTP